MSASRRSRASWEELVAEVERSGSVARTAERHGVNPQRLSWWRWALGREEKKRAGTTRLLPVVVAEPGTHPPSIAWLEVVASGVAIRVPIGSDVGYVAALVAAIRATC